MEKLSILRAKAVRTLKKNHYESLYWGQGQLVCGLDEAGRGPLAGPLVTAAVIVPLGTKYYLLKDSKCMTPEERERAFKWISDNAFYAVGIVPVPVIDIINIWYATLLGMRRAVMQLMSTYSARPAAFLVDAMPLSMKGTSYADIPVHAFVYGERLSCSVAAASIVAKVIRDRIMEKTHPLFPLYNFDKHKGYATPTHRGYIQIYNRSLAHRITYMPSLNIANQKEGDDWKQEELC
ncbi:MAG TPA: ribonuclease HII [Candidatus Babeliales bacterium]|jgi:ribonuclease HII|nr:ribonuclease HII [Candidatus Babeliales bacterium]